MNQKLDMQNLKLKAANYCAYQERSVLEVKQKLKTLGANQLQVSQIVDELIDEGFIDEVRFAHVYAKGKFRQNKWGKLKIAYALQQKGINKNLIEEAIDGIDEKIYLDTVRTLVEKKNSEIKDDDPWVRKNKIAQSVTLKGFEAELVLAVINDVL